MRNELPELFTSRSLLRHCCPYRPAYLVRHGMVVVCALAYFAATFGVPIPIAAPSASQATESTPYPCQHHQCGCRSAEQCRRACCCFSHAEQDTWYRAHRLTPPAQVAAREPAHQKQPASSKCCSAHRKPSSVENIHSSQPTVELVSSIQALRCQGLSTYWLTIGAVWPAAAADAPIVDLPPTAWITSPAILYRTTSRVPPVPPPRLVA